MDDRENPNLATLVIEVVKPMLFGAIAALLLLPISLVIAVGLLGGPAAILFVVRSVNHRDDPRHAKRPPGAAA